MVCAQPPQFSQQKSITTPTACCAPLILNTLLSKLPSQRAGAADEMRLPATELYRNLKTTLVSSATQSTFWLPVRLILNCKLANKNQNQTPAAWAKDTKYCANSVIWGWCKLQRCAGWGCASAWKKLSIIEKMNFASYFPSSTGTLHRRPREGIFFT